MSLEENITDPKRLPTKEMPVMPKAFYDKPNSFYFPINVPQVENLMGRLLTHIEALNMPERAEKANKDMVRKTLWSWFGDVQENSITSYKGCIAPIEVEDSVPSDSEL